MKRYRLLTKYLQLLGCSPYTSSQKCVRCYSSATPKVKEQEEDVKRGINTNDSATKVRVLKKFKEPFPKSLFVGKCDAEILEYPEVLSNDNIILLNNNINLIHETLREHINPKEIDTTGVIPLKTIQHLKHLNLFGLNVPKEYGGLNCTATEIQYYEEASTLDSSIWKFLHDHHQAVVPIFKYFGTDQQKLQYLPKLASGEIYMTLATTEKGGPSDIATDVTTSGIFVEDTNSYEITGSKHCVLNAGLAHYFIVLTSTFDKDHQRGLTVFLVDKSSPGVSVSAPTKMSGFRGLDVASVNFKKVIVPQANVLGEPNKGFDVIYKLMQKGKLNSSAFAISTMKSLINLCTKYLINMTVGNLPCNNVEYIKYSVGRMSTALYAVESAAYLLQGISDLYEDPDIFIDSCILKVVSSEKLRFTINEAVQLLGPVGYCDPAFEDLSKIVRDADFHSCWDDSDGHLKITISMLGLQYAGVRIQEKVKMERNPFMFPAYMLKKFFTNRGTPTDDFNIKLGFPWYLHPTLENTAKLVEYSIARLQMATEILLSRYGAEVIKEQIELKMLADILIKIYCCIAVLGRASRSYCIGLRNGECEMETAHVYVRQCYREIIQLTQDIEDGPFFIDIKKTNKISESVFFEKKYFAEHPITRNF